MHPHLTALFDRQGYIDSNDPAAALALAEWNFWWSSTHAPSLQQARIALDAALARPRLAPLGNSSTRPPSIRTLAWVRTSDHVVADRDDFPYHHTVAETADYLSSRWNATTALRSMRGAEWKLHERPGGWAALVGANGNHRSLVALASGVPLVQVTLTCLTTYSGQPYLLSDPTGKRPAQLPWTTRLRNLGTSQHWSRSTSKTLTWLANEGLMGRVDHDAILQARRFQRTEIDVGAVSPELPWVVAETIEEARARRARLAELF